MSECWAWKFKTRTINLPQELSCTQKWHIWRNQAARTVESEKSKEPSSSCSRNRCHLAWSTQVPGWPAVSPGPLRWVHSAFVGIAESIATDHLSLWCSPDVSIDMYIGQIFAVWNCNVKKLLVIFFLLVFPKIIFVHWRLQLKGPHMLNM